MFGPFLINASIINIMEIVNQGNILVENRAPWKLATDTADLSKVKLNAVLYRA